MIYNILIIYISIVFLCAGVLRLIFSNDAYKEKTILLPFIPYAEKIIPWLEIVLGILLLTRYQRAALYLLAIGLIIYTLSVIWTQYEYIFYTLNKVCTYRGTFTHVTLHITYLAIIIYLITNASTFP